MTDQTRTLLDVRQGPAGVTSRSSPPWPGRVEVLDIEQIVLRRRLILGILVTAPRDWKRLRDAVQETADGPRA